MRTKWLNITIDYDVDVLKEIIRNNIECGDKPILVICAPGSGTIAKLNKLKYDLDFNIFETYYNKYSLLDNEVYNKTVCTTYDKTINRDKYGQVVFIEIGTHFTLSNKLYLL